MSGLSQDETLPVPPADGPGLFGDIPASSPVTDASHSNALPAPPPAYRVLARKYRPTRFDDLIGQDAMVRILRNAFALGRIAHAFMLTGVRGVGKTTTARIIARALNCVGPDGGGGPTPDPCGVCANCTAILADRHPDVIEMDAASRTGVDDVREIIEATRFRPLQARTKVFIVDEVHMLSRNAFNALLKTLEEPPPHVKFVFATTELRKVPVTVLSRCQRFDLRRIAASELAAQFARIAAAERVAISADALAMIARAADGSVRDGLSLLDQAIAQSAGAGGAGEITATAVAEMLGLADRSLVFELMEAVMAGRAAEALAITGRAHELGLDLGQLLGDLLELTHTLTRLKTVPDLRRSLDLPEAERSRGAALADALPVPTLGRAWQMLLKGTAEVEAAPDRRAAAEMVLIRLCHVADLPTPGELVRQLSGATAQQDAPVPKAPSAAGHGNEPPLGWAPLAPQIRVPPAAAGAGQRQCEPPGRVDPSSAPGRVDPSSTQSGTQHGSYPTGPAAAEARRIMGRHASEPQQSGLPSWNAPGPRGGVPAGAAGAGSSSGGLAASAAAKTLAAPEGAAMLPAGTVETPPRLASFRDVAALVAARREPLLHGHLLHSVHCVRFAPPVIELRPEPAAPANLAARLAALLGEATGTRWTIALSTAPGEPTLAAQGDAADAARRDAASGHPLVRAILDAFPGARIAAVHDATVDAYGLPREIAEMPLGESEMPEFAPPDAEPAELMEDDL